QSNDGRGNICLDRLSDCPAPLAGVVHVRQNALHLRVGSESFGCQVQQPGTHNTSVPPQFSNLGEVETEFSFPVQQGKAFGISLHQTVFNPVVHHFDEV